MPRKVFVAGEILTAADVNTNLMDQAVMVFDDATARATAIPTPVEGMVTYLKDTDEVDKFDGTDFVPVGIAPAILQVVSVDKTDTFTTASTTFVDVTGLSVSITPSSASSKLLILWSVHLGNTDRSHNSLFVVADGSDTILLQGDGGSGLDRALGAHRLEPSLGSESITNAAGSFLFSPATTSAFTVKGRLRTSSATATLNRKGSEAATTHPRAVSSLTVMEVAG